MAGPSYGEVESTRHTVAATYDAYRRDPETWRRNLGADDVRKFKYSDTTGLKSPVRVYRNCGNGLALIALSPELHYDQ